MSSKNIWQALLFKGMLPTSLINIQMFKHLDVRLKEILLDQLFYNVAYLTRSLGGSEFQLFVQRLRQVDRSTDIVGVSAFTATGCFLGKFRLVF